MTYESTITQLDGTTTDFDTIISTQLELAHTELHRGILEVKPEVTDPTDVALGDLDIDLDNSALFRGEIFEVTEDEPIEGYATIEALGPGYALTRESPTQEVGYANTSRFDAIDDYYNNHLGNVNTSTTVTEPTPNTLEDDAKIEDIPTNTSFPTEFSIADDEPIQFNNSEIQLQDHGFPEVTSDFGGTFTTQFDSSGQSYFHINGEYAVIIEGENVVGDHTPEYDIPAERVGVVVHYKVTDSTDLTISDINLEFNNTRVGFNQSTAPDHDPTGGDMGYKDYTTEYADNGGGDLSSGTTYFSELNIDATADGEIEVDFLYIYDTKYNQNLTFDEPTSLDEAIDGPSFLPGYVDLTSGRHFEQGNITEARLETTWNDTTNDQRISLSNDDANNFIHGNNQSNLTADFDANNQYGSTLRSKLRFSGSNTGNGTWLAKKAVGQDLQDYKLYVTVTDIQVIGPEGITLRENHFENLKTLHDGEWRFVVDPTIRDPVTIESFREGRNGSKKTDDWHTTDASQTRDVRDYANQLKFIYNDTNGDRTSLTVQRPGEISNKNNTTIQAIKETTDQLTNREAHNRALTELDNAISVDKTTGNITAWAKLLLPGYTYTVDEWNLDASIERVRYQEGSDRALMTMQFVDDKDITAQVINLS